MKTTYDFKDKRIWLTGASSGIGLALANRLINAGAKLIVSARNEERLLQLFTPGEKLVIAHGDLVQLSINHKIMRKAQEFFGGIDCVILNAGNAEYIDVKNFSAEPFERMIESNFLSMVRGIEAVLPLLRESNAPYLVGMSSSVAWQGLPQGQAYSASKAAIRNLFQGLKIELAAENIDVSWICPGFVKTPLTDKNTFSMPARIEADEAAQIIYADLCRKKTEIHFPKKFTWLLKSLSLLPAGFSAKLLKGTVPVK